MKTFLNAIMKLLALLAAGVLIAALPLSLIYHNTGEALFSPEVIRQVSRTVIVESDLVPGALEFITNQRAEEISQGIEEEQEGEQQLNLFYLIEGMEVEDWRNVRKELLTEEILSSWIGSTISGLFEWLNSDQQVPGIRWDMRPVIDRMSGPPGKRVVTTFYNSLPDCTDLQMEEMQTEPGEPLPKVEMVENLCKLSTFPHQEQITVYQEIMGLATERIPPSYNLTSTLVNQEEGMSTPLAAKRDLREFRRSTDLVLLIPLGLLFLILVLGVRSLAELGQWWGIPLVAGSLIAFLTALLFRPLWTGLLSERMPEAIPATSVFYHELISASARLVSEIFNPLRWQSFLILLIGIGLTVAGFALRLGGMGKSE